MDGILNLEVVSNFDFYLRAMKTQLLADIIKGALVPLCPFLTASGVEPAIFTKVMLRIFADVNCL